MTGWFRAETAAVANPPINSSSAIGDPSRLRSGTSTVSMAKSVRGLPNPCLASKPRHAAACRTPVPVSDWAGNTAVMGLPPRRSPIANAAHATPSVPDAWRTTSARPPMPKYPAIAARISASQKRMPLRRMPARSGGNIAVAPQTVGITLIADGRGRARSKAGKCVVRKWRAQVLAHAAYTIHCDAAVAPRRKGSPKPRWTAVIRERTNDTGEMGHRDDPCFGPSE